MNKWKLTTVEVTKDRTVRWYENDNGYTKREYEQYKYTQYHSKLDFSVTTYYDKDGVEVKESEVKWA